MSVSISGAGSISGLDQGFNVTSGNVGISTDNPTEKLEVLGSTLLKGTSSTATALKIRGAGTQGDDATISFTNGYTQTFKIGMSDDIGPARDFIISETSTGSSSDNENPKYIFNGNGDGIFQITDRAGGDVNVQLATSGISYLTGGNFGIGTNSPNHKLTLFQSGTGTFDAVNFVTGNTNSSGYQMGVNSSGEVFHWNTTNSSINFATNNAERFRIESNGEIRQQNSGGSTIYELKRADSNTTGSVGTINFTASDGHSVASMSAMGDGDNEGAHIVFRTTSAAANNSPYNAATPERLRIESGGGLKFTGQGTSIPVGGILHHTNNNLYVRGGTNGLVLGNQDNTNTIHISESNYIKFETTDGTERLRISSSGQLLLGTTDAGINSGDNLTIADSGHCGLTIRSGTSSQGNIFFSDGTSGNSEYDGFIQYQQDTQSMLFGAGGGNSNFLI